MRARAAGRAEAAVRAGAAVRATAVLLAVVVGACGPSAPVTAPAVGDADREAFLDDLQERTFRWFWELTDPRTGLTPDRAPTESFSSIAAVGFALTAYPIGVERGWISEAEARERTRATLEFFWSAPQGPEPAGVTGYRGFFYHFLDMGSGTRFGTTELSTIDTTLLLGGVLLAAVYFDGGHPDEARIRALADSLYRRVDWAWARAEGREPRVAMGWKPGEGFGPADWEGYNEAMLLYVLAFASPTHAVEPEAWDVWTSTYRWAEFQGQEHVNFAPLFGHQYSHVWIDFRGIQDDYMRARAIDYFENSRRATLAQRAYAIENPMRWEGYGEDVWGLTASDGPGDVTRPVDGEPRRFHSYWARGAAAADVRDDGTIVPTAAGGSIPFAPEAAIRALMTIRARWGDHVYDRYGFVDAFNPTFTFEDAPLRHGRVVPGEGWFDDDQLGIDQGPILIMAENHRTGLVWELMKESEPIVRGLCLAGFAGGWLEGQCDR